MTITEPDHSAARSVPSATRNHLDHLTDINPSQSKGITNRIQVKSNQSIHSKQQRNQGSRNAQAAHHQQVRPSNPSDREHHTDALPPQPVQHHQTVTWSKRTLTVTEIETCHLGAEARSKGQRKAGSGRRTPAQPLQNEQDGGRRHVAMILENTSGFEQQLGGQRENL